jgi:hypothetical protein
MRGIREEHMREQGRTSPAADTRGEELHASPMMAHLLDTLEEETDVGYYGRLVVAMVARFFLDEDELVRLLAKQPDQTEEDARALVAQVRQHGYNPPAREPARTRTHSRMAGAAGLPNLSEHRGPTGVQRVSRTALS